MSDVSIAELQPFLNPDYWGGHSIGFGEIGSVQPKTRAKVRAPRQIRSMFQDRIATLERIVPLETFNSGETFDASNYYEGTVVMFREEQLRGGAGRLNVDVESLKGQPIPSRPTSFASGLGSGASPTEFLRSDGASYTNTVVCGMVGKNQDGKELVVHATSARLIEQFGGGKVMAGGIWWTYPMPIKIGNTVHTARPQRGELVHRVNLLEVVAYGERERRREKVRGFISGLAFRPQGT